MKEEQKTKIANNLHFASKIFIIAFVIIFFIVCVVGGESVNEKHIGNIFIVSLICVGIGYLCRLIKWVYKWKD